jgi:hypothetical protein
MAHVMHHDKVLMIAKEDGNGASAGSRTQFVIVTFSRGVLRFDSANRSAELVYP